MAYKTKIVIRDLFTRSSSLVRITQSVIDQFEEMRQIDGDMPLVKLRDFINEIEEVLFYLESIFEWMIIRLESLVAKYVQANQKLLEVGNELVADIDLSPLEDASMIYSTLSILSKLIKAFEQDEPE
ncbi:hypothetical protein LCGC14_0175930 [marine sediment metagenome]|uniref:Uncharacterized protein n=1 Tax=marine sediment metagenome TaxID=412755 RepID=A0A0F9UVF7_9ZZZZ